MFVHNTQYLLQLLTCCIILLYSACARINSNPNFHDFVIMKNDDFLIVKTSMATECSTLAARYLDDPDKAFLIAEFNGIEAVSSGQEVVIPLHPFRLGGLETNGYQMVPVLAYQRVSKDRADEVTVAMEHFEKQMKYLKKNDYHVITLDQLFNFINFKEQLPKKSIAITFDGCSDSFYEIAWPLLKKYDFCCTLFLDIDCIDTENTLSWEKINELLEMGVDIQPYINMNRNIDNIEKIKEEGTFSEYVTAIERELIRSQEEFKRNANKECKYLAYDYSKDRKFTNLFIILLKKHGYRAAFTTRDHANPFFVDNYMINRSVIYGTYDMQKFKKSLVTFWKIDLQ
ncbi:MAG: polysaccharide deacetylase family protein [bacterium]